jgi:hypothetical protein
MSVRGERRIGSGHQQPASHAKVDNPLGLNFSRSAAI